MNRAVVIFGFDSKCLQCGAPKIAKLVYNYTKLGFMVIITLRWAHKPTYNVWGPHIVVVEFAKNLVEN